MDKLIQIGEEFSQIQKEVDEEQNRASNNNRTIADSSISGELSWKSDSNEEFPLQYSLVSFYDRDALSEELLYTCLTDENGRFTFEFNNDTSEGENGLDIFMRVWACGADVSVTYGRIGTVGVDIYYYKDYDLFSDFSTGHRSVAIDPIEMEKDDGLFLFGHAIQISQAAIMASKYYEEMKGQDVNNLPTTYPHNISDNDNCFYNNLDIPNGRIYIVGDYYSGNGITSYGSWDVIMHEYGHFVANMEGIADPPGGWHLPSIPMAEHYRKHFSTDNDCTDISCAFYVHSSVIPIYSVDDCKSKGSKISWSEGFATYFSMVSQEYAKAHFGLGNIPYVGDGKITSCYDTNEYSIENHEKGTDSTEATIQTILYDMYDKTKTGDIEGLALGHEIMWSMIMNSQATAFYQFDDYFRENCSDQEKIKQYCNLLGEVNIAPHDVYSYEDITTNCPTFRWILTTNQSIAYYDEYSYKLNFYDASFEYIGSTPEYENNYITVNETLWQAVLDSGGDYYVSVTMFENQTPKTGYEGEWCHFECPVKEISINASYTHNILIGDSYWYKFTPPIDSDYLFVINSTTNLVVEKMDGPVVGQSMLGLRGFYGDEESESFNFNQSLDTGESIYLRVRGDSWTETGAFTLSVYINEHTHVYTHHYTKINATQHKAYCECGSYITQLHSWKIELGQSTCKHCNYVSTGPVLKDDIPIIGDDPLLYEE